MLSTISSLFQMRSQAKQYQAQASILEANARGTRKAANAQAAYIEQTAKANQSIAGENLMRGRTNQRAALAAAENTRSSSGLSGGTTGQPVANLRRQLDIELANIAQSASIASINAWQGALDTRRKGEMEAYKQEVTADQYRRAAHSIYDSMTISAISSIASAAIGAYTGYQNSQNAIANADQSTKSQITALGKAHASGLITDAAYNQQIQSITENHNSVMGQLQSNVLPQTLLSASQYGSAAFDIVNSFNPYTAALDANPSTRKNNYGGPWSVLMGNIPYRVPGQNNLYTYN